MKTRLTYKGQNCKIRGTVEASRPCDCCGNVVLERAIAIELQDADGNDTGDVLEIGCVCASKNIFGSSRNARKIKSLAENADYWAEQEIKQENARIRFRMVHKMQTEHEGFQADDYRRLARLVYHKTGRPAATSWMWHNGDWAVVVELGDPKDVTRWTAQGFAPLV